jgi:hypothetical protein
MGREYRRLWCVSIHPFTPSAIRSLIYAANDVIGDGIVQSGEACDCGLSNCTIVDPCCVQATCQVCLSHFSFFVIISIFICAICTSFMMV